MSKLSVKVNPSVLHSTKLAPVSFALPKRVEASVAPRQVELLKSPECITASERSADAKFAFPTRQLFQCVRSRVAPLKDVSTKLQRSNTNPLIGKSERSPASKLQSSKPTTPR